MYNGTTYYYQRNGQGDIIGMYNSSGTKVVSYTYDVWGKLLTTSGSLASTLGENNPLRYRGYYYDNETGFYYLQSRYYDPTTGRFISPDVLVSTGQSIIGYNMFAYCLNNPVNMSDESGCVASYNVMMTDSGGGCHASYTYQNENCKKFVDDLSKEVLELYAGPGTIIHSIDVTQHYDIEITDEQAFFNDAIADIGISAATAIFLPGGWVVQTASGVAMSYGLMKLTSDEAIVAGVYDCYEVTYTGRKRIACTNDTYSLHKR
jgi:RHS repeat-associated protein